MPISFNSRWKNTTPGVYNVEIDAGWVDASRQAIKFSMDPRNFLFRDGILQFEKLSFDENSVSIEGIERIFYGTEFYNRIPEGETRRLSEMILEAGREARVNPYHLASRIRLEVGPHLSHPSISGDIEGYEGLFNFYNIGATSEPIFMDVIRNGLRFARQGRPGINLDEMLIPWNSRQRAITGGAIFIGSRYINVRTKYDISTKI